MPRRILLLCLCWLYIAPVWAEGVIHLILSDQGNAYQETAEAFRDGVGQRQVVKIWALADLGASQAKSMTQTDDLVVPVGVKAARFVAEHHAGQAAVLSLMIPRAISEKLQWPVSLGRKKISAVYIDQLANRSLGLIAAAFPAARRVGLLISAENAAVAKLLTQEAVRHNLKLNMETVDAADDVAPALRRVLPESDVLLLVPDAIAINAGNAQNVLLTTYRFRIPVIGFSQGLAKAGAVASVYSSPAQIGRQGAQIATRQREGGELPPSQHAGEFSLAFNAHVARSLGISLPNEGDIRRKLGAQSE